MGCHFLLLGIFPIQGSSWCLTSPALAGGFFTTSAIWEESIGDIKLYLQKPLNSMERVAALSVTAMARLGGPRSKQRSAWSWKPRICPLTFRCPLLHRTPHGTDFRPACLGVRREIKETTCLGYLTGQSWPSLGKENQLKTVRYFHIS